jgi:hypothetical protein
MSASGHDDLSSGEARTVKPLLRFLCLGARREWAGEHLLPAVQYASTIRQTERRDLSGD